MMARKRKKADAQMTEISVSADGDFGETKMTESWQVCISPQFKVGCGSLVIGAHD